MEVPAVVQGSGQARQLHGQAALPMGELGSAEPRRGRRDGLVQGQHAVQLLHGNEPLQPEPRADQLPGGRDIVLIALTGWGQEEDRRRSRDAGFDHHLTKPVEFAALQRLLAALPGGVKRA